MTLGQITSDHKKQMITITKKAFGLLAVIMQNGLGKIDNF
jgi:hypothetical protein